jgi:hypothetical protein
VIVVLAGVPAAHFNRVQKLAPRIFGSGTPLVATPLLPDGSGRYRPDVAHAERLVTALIKRTFPDGKLLEDGIGVLILTPKGFDGGAFAETFRPFALTSTIALPEPVEIHGRRGDMSANNIAAALRVGFPPLARAVRAVMTEVTARLNRTPLLLPLRNFSSDVLDPAIQALWQRLPTSADPASEIAAACRRIEARHPYGRIGGSSRRCFQDDRRIQFRSPARAHHGMAASKEPPHDQFCWLNGRARLGGRCTDGFHYDCIRDFSEGRRELPLTAKVSDCHGVPERLTGKPHINIAPNDFCRV